MEIDVRQRNQRSLKRRERALRMQAERESNQGQAQLLANGIVSDVAGSQTAADASGDSCDEDDVLLLKRSPMQQQQQQVLSGTGPGSVVRRHKKSSGAAPAASVVVGEKVAANNTEATTTTTPITTTSTTTIAMKEEVSVDWLKMEPRLMTPEENGVDPLVDMEAIEEDGEEESPLLEEDVIDGFAILAFKTYDDLEVRKGGLCYEDSDSNSKAAGGD